MATDDVMGGGHLYTVKPVNVYDVTAAGKDSLDAAQQLEMQRRQLNAQASQNAADRATQARQNALNRQAQQRENEATRAAERDMAEKRMRFEQEQSNKEFQRTLQIQQVGLEKDAGLSAADSEYGDKMADLDNQENEAQQEYNDAVANGDMARATKANSVLSQIQSAKEALSHNLSVVDTAHNLMNFGDSKAQAEMMRQAIATNRDIAESLGANDVQLNSVISDLKATRGAFQGKDDLSPLGVKREDLMDPGVAIDLIRDPEAPEDKWYTWSDVEESGYNQIEMRKRVRELFFKKAGQPLVLGPGGVAQNIPAGLLVPLGPSNGGTLNEQGMKLWEESVREAELEQSAPGMKKLADFMGELSVGDIKNQSGQADVEGTQRRIYRMFTNLQKASNLKGAEAQKFLDDAASEMRGLIDAGLNTEIFGSVYQAVSTQLGSDRFGDRSVSSMTPTELATMMYMRSQKEMGQEADPEALQSIKDTQFVSPYHTLSLLGMLKDPKTSKSMLGSIQPGLTYYKTKSGKVMSVNRVEEVMLDVMGLISTNLSGSEDMMSMSQYLDDVLDNDPKTAFTAGQKINSLPPEFQSVVMEILKNRQKTLENLSQTSPTKNVPGVDFMTLNGFSLGGLPGMNQTAFDQLLQNATGPSATRADMKALQDFLAQSESSLRPGEGGQSLAGARMRMDDLRQLNKVYDAKKKQIEASRQKAREEKTAAEKRATGEASRKLRNIQ